MDIYKEVLDIKKKYDKQGASYNNRTIFLSKDECKTVLRQIHLKSKEIILSLENIAVMEAYLEMDAEELYFDGQFKLFGFTLKYDFQDAL